MEAGNLLRFIPLNQRLVYSSRFSSFLHSRTVTVNASLRESGYKGIKPRREWIADWVSNNDDFVRGMPIYVGGLSLLAVLFNRTLSGIAPVADASSSQSRADLLTLGLAVTNILNGLVWLSIRPKSISVINPNGVQCQRVDSHLPDFVISELLWAWNSLSDVTCCRSLVIVYDGKCTLQTGFAAASLSNGNDAVAVDTNRLIAGSLYQGVLKSASQSYLANLSLYPGKSELPFLPSNTQNISCAKRCVHTPITAEWAFLSPKNVVSFKAVILQPLGDKGIAIIGGDTIRGFTSSDQVWIALIGEKLDATLTKVF